MASQVSFSLFFFFNVVSGFLEAEGVERKQLTGP